MYDYYLFVKDISREHHENLIKEGEQERKWRKFVKDHPEYKFSSRMRLFLEKMLGHKHEVDNIRNQEDIALVRCC